MGYEMATGLRVLWKELRGWGGGRDEGRVTTAVFTGPSIWTSLTKQDRRFRRTQPSLHYPINGKSIF